MPALVKPTSPKDPKDADDSVPGANREIQRSGSSSDGDSSSTPPPDPPQHKPEENKDKKSWIALELVYESNGKPVAGMQFEVTLPDGKTIAGGSTDEKGKGRVENIDPGSCQISFPTLDKEAWEDA